MNLGMIFKVAVLAILRNKTRALLTCIGIIVGIAAVIAVLAIGKGASTMMVREISSMGNNLMMVFPDRHRKGQVKSGMGAGQTMTAGDAEAALGAIEPPHVEVGQLDLLQRARARQQVEVLEDEAELAVADVREFRTRTARDLDAVQQVAAARGRVEAAEDVQHRRLAAAGGAHDRDELARVDRERHAVQRRDRLLAERVDLAEIPDFD